LRDQVSSFPSQVHEALALVEIRVLDHLIVAGADVVSLAERGVL
jgi:DNA repair protein RadC